MRPLWQWLAGCAQAMGFLMIILVLPEAQAMQGSFAEDDLDGIGQFQGWQATSVPECNDRDTAQIGKQLSLPAYADHDLCEKLI